MYIIFKQQCVKDLMKVNVKALDIFKILVLVISIFIWEVLEPFYSLPYRRGC